jgi:hypothetical protein
MANTALGRIVGLIISGPENFYNPDGKASGLKVFMVMSETVRVKLFYKLSDDTEKLKALIAAENLPEDVTKQLERITQAYNYEDPSTLSRKLPGVDLEAKHPVSNEKGSLWSIIISLNDAHRWTREAIADWIENTFDTKDIAFSAVEVNDEASGISQSTKLVVQQRIL